MNDRMPLNEDEDLTVRLLRLAGPRPPAPDARAARVREAVHGHWQARGRRRRIRRRSMAAVLVAAAAVLVVMASRERRVDRPPDIVNGATVVAVVERIEGSPRRASNGAGTLALNESLRAGESVHTDAGRVALRFSTGTTVRIDQGSRARAISAAAVELSAGAVYVDTAGTSGRFEVRTPVATAHDIGTQFEVRLIESALRLRVRSGIVELRHGTRLVSGRGGTEVTFTATDATTRSLAPFGREWDWVAGLAPLLEFEGLALAAFLERIASEQGWQLRYADAALADEARSITLHGSASGLQTRQALDIALTTSSLQYRLENGELTVFRGARPKKPM